MPHPTQSELLNTVLQLFIREGLEGFAEGIRLLVNEAMRLERATILQAAPYECRPSALAAPLSVITERSWDTSVRATSLLRCCE